jgi:molecular chaperone GrpE
VTEHERDAGPGTQSGPAREQIVIKDNRKIDSTGRPKDAGDKGDAAQPAGAQQQAAQQSGAKEQTPPGGIGQPGTPVGSAPAKEGKPSGDPSGDKDAKDAKTPAAQSTQGAAQSPAKGDSKVEAKAPSGLGAELESLRSELDERLKDLQRVSAEYANYRKRVERDRGVVVEQAVGAVLSSLLPILDDVDRAREHGDLNGPFAAVAEQLTTALAKFGLNAFGEKGDAFDPTRHEAVTHETSPDVTEPTCVSVMRRGYLLGDRLLRPAMVAVADPE